VGLHFIKPPGDRIVESILEGITKGIGSCCSHLSDSSKIIGGEVSGQMNLRLAMTMPMQETTKIQRNRVEYRCCSTQYGRCYTRCGARHWRF